MRHPSILAFLFALLVSHALAIGFCRENNVCLDTPHGAGTICKCWSTCSPVKDARQCDNANELYSGYERENIGGSDVACSYIPFLHNARDLCIWFYDPDLDLSQQMGTEFFRDTEE